MESRRYYRGDGGLTDERNRRDQLAAELAGRVVSERNEERGGHGGGEGRQFGQRNGSGDDQGRGQRESERGGRVGGRPVGRSDDEGCGAAAGNLERNVQRAGERGGEQDGGVDAGLGTLELGQILADATQALASLNGEALRGLELRALDLIRHGATVMAVPEIEARHRVFAAVVEATRENLNIMERAGSRGLYGDTRTRNPWVR